ncbi:unnamed protein product [Rangifer tarandus platyrhynchus]|uniref:Uncharacterized protein n=1 Tax=Rangifer tarandus platyrhynchus TaxID=3082113 RepID=A0AC59YB79_RANTA
MGTKEVSPGGTSSTALAPFVTHIACQGTRGIARVHAATWPGLGQDDGPRRTVDVSEWELTAHLPGPTYAGPATPSPSSGLAGGAGGLVAVTGPGERLGLSACRGKKARGAGQERGAERRRRRRPERERRARRWRRPRRNERGAGEPVAQAAAPRTGRARARAPRIARSPGIRTSRASGGRRQAGGGEGTCARRRVRFPGASRLGLERAGGGGGRRSPRSGRAPVSAAGDAGRSWGFATRPIKSSPAVPLLPGKLRGWSSELGPPPPPPPPASSGGGDGIWQISARPHRAG